MVTQHQPIKYACPCLGIKVTPAASRIVERGLFTEPELAWIVTAMYQDALPLYRQAALVRRPGGDLSRNTLVASIARVGEAVQPVINLLRDALVESDLVYGDEIVLQALKEPGRVAQTRSCLWEQMSGTGPPVRLFHYAPGRGGRDAARLAAGIAERFRYWIPLTMFQYHPCPLGKGGRCACAARFPEDVVALAVEMDGVPGVAGAD